MKFKIGTDIKLNWAITKPDGSPEDFDNILSLKVYIRHSILLKRYEQEYTINGNVINIQFTSKEQLFTGEYDLLLVVTKADNTIEGGIATYNFQNLRCFELVLINEDTEEGVLTTSINLSKGDSAYQIALMNGFVGTEVEWLESLKGDEGKSAYQIAVDNGYVGTETEWLTSLAVSTDTLYITDRPKIVFKDSVKTINNESILGVGNINIIGGIQVESDPIYSADKPFIALKSDLSNYSEINHTHNEYLTVHQDISHLATKAEIPTNVSQLINDSGYLTVHQDLSHLALKTEIPTNVSQLINDSGYLTQHQDISNKQDLLISGSNIKTINNQSILGTGNIVIEGGTGGTGIENETDPIYLADKPSIALKSELPDISTKQDVLVSGINIKTVNNQSLLGLGNIEITGGIASETDPIYTSEKSTLALKTDLDAYAKKTEIPVIPAETDPVWTADKINYALKTEIPTVPTNVSAFINDSGYLTQHQSLTDYAKKTDIPDITSLAYKSEIPSNTSELINDSGYITDYTETDPVYQIEKPTLALKADLTGLATEAYVTNRLNSLELTGSGVEVGITEPTDPLVNIWIDTSGEGLEESNIALKSEIPVISGYNFTGSEIDLSNPLGAYQITIANTSTAYTLSANKVIGGWSKIKINASTEPTVTDGIKIKGSDFTASTDMYLLAEYNGTTTEYYFAEI